MKIGTTPAAVEYGVVLVALSGPVALAGFHLATLVNQVLTILLTQVGAVAMAIGG